MCESLLNLAMTFFSRGGESKLLNFLKLFMLLLGLEEISLSLTEDDPEEAGFRDLIPIISHFSGLVFLNWNFGADFFSVGEDSTLLLVALELGISI